MGDCSIQYNRSSTLKGQKMMKHDFGTTNVHGVLRNCVNNNNKIEAVDLERDFVSAHALAELERLKLEEKCEKLKQEIRMLNGTEKKVEERFGSMIDKKDERILYLSEQIAEMDRQIQAKVRENEMLKSDKLEGDKTVENMRCRMSEAYDVFEKLKSEKLEGDKTVANMRREMLEAHDVLDKLRGQLVAADVEKVWSEEIIAELRCEVVKLDQIVENLKGQNLETLQEVEGMRSMRRQMLEAYDVLDKLRGQLVEANVEKMWSEEIIAELRCEVVKLDQIVENLKGQNLEALQEVEGLRSQLLETSQAVEELKCLKYEADQTGGEIVKDQRLNQELMADDLGDQLYENESIRIIQFSSVAGTYTVEQLRNQEEEAKRSKERGANYDQPAAQTSHQRSDNNPTRAESNRTDKGHQINKFQGIDIIYIDSDDDIDPSGGEDTSPSCTIVGEKQNAFPKLVGSPHPSTNKRSRSASEHVSPTIPKRLKLTIGSKNDSLPSHGRMEEQNLESNLNSPVSIPKEFSQKGISEVGSEGTSETSENGEMLKAFQEDARFCIDAVSALYQSCIKVCKRFKWSA